MKKRSKICLILLILVIAVIGGGYYTKVNNVKDEHISDDSDLSFVVLGDVHDDTSGFKAAIDDFYKLNKNIDALILNGDTVDQGKDEQYEDIESVLASKKNKLPENIIKNIGNHEFYDYDENTNSLEYMQSFMDKYLKFSETEKVYHDTWVNNYHFISLGSDDLEDENYNTTSASLTSEQLSWLEDTLKQDYVEGKPIFVFLHQPISVTFFGNPYYGVNNYNELLKILSKYPEVILFSSHTHKEFGDDYLQTDLNVTRIHTGAVSYTIVKDENADSGFRRDESYNNGLYIEVKSNDVVVNGRNIADHTWTFSNTISTNKSEN